MKQRKLRLTASMFGKVIKLKPKTSCLSTIKTLLYSTFKGSDSTRYGNENEPLAIKDAQSLLGLTITACGLFIDEDNPHLAASPDGLIGQDGIIEIKCPSGAATMTPSEAIKNKKVTFCTLDANDPIKIKLKETHNYYYQVQGQLNITKRKYCYFVLWTPKGMMYQKIMRDSKIWEEMMIKLNIFYMQCILPEILDPRLPRKLPIRDRF